MEKVKYYLLYTITTLYTPIVKLIKSYMNNTTGEVLVSGEVLDILNNSSEQEKKELLNELYDLKQQK